MLRELNLVEQRYQAVLGVVRDGATVTDVAVVFGVTRQTVHRWLRLYAKNGLEGLVDGSARPLSNATVIAPVTTRRSRSSPAPATRGQGRGHQLIDS